MKKYLQKALSILLILCIAVSALLYLFYDIAQFQYKNQAQDEIKSEESLEVITISICEFNKIKGSGEIWHEGNLYDIGSYKIMNDKVLVTVFHDCNEESLIHSIVDSFEPNDKITSDNIVHINRHHIHPPDDCKILVENMFSAFSLETAKITSFQYLSPSYTSLNFSVIKPPPEVVLIS